MERISARAIAYAGFFALLCAMAFAGIALVAFGLQSGLSESLGVSGSALIVGFIFLAAPAAVFIASYVRSKRKPAENDKVLPLNISTLAKSAFVGLAATRPLTALGLAAAASIARSSLVERGKP